MNGLSCIFYCFVWLIVCTCSMASKVWIMNNCSPSHCLHNGVGMLGLDWTKTMHHLCNYLPQENCL